MFKKYFVNERLNSLENGYRNLDFKFWALESKQNTQVNYLFEEISILRKEIKSLKTN